MDPTTTTRERWTQGLVDGPVPSQWPQEVKDCDAVLKSLIDKLGHHSAMTPNNQQTFATPANSKNKVYFMWDFVGRTLGLIQLNFEDVTSLDNLNQVQQELWMDVIQRNVLASSLILDTRPGMLNNLVEQTNPGNAGNHPGFGDDIKADARRLDSV